MRYLRFVLFSISILAVTAVLGGCGATLTMDSRTSASGTGPAPTVVAVGEQVNGVAPNRKQEVQFSEAMESATINAQTFQVTDSSGKVAQGMVSYDSNFNTASFLPNPALQSDASYTVTITTGVASAGGVHLASPYTYTFEARATSDTSPLSVNLVSPAAGATCVSATTPIVITFDEAPDASTLNPANLAVSGPGGAIPVKISTNVTTTQAVLTPSSPLPTGNITVTVQNVGDLADVMMAAPYTWSFSTACGGGGSASGNEYLYSPAGVVAGTPEFYAYAIDATTGNLTPVPGMPFPASVGTTPTPCGGPACGAMEPLADPVGRFLFYSFNNVQHGVGTMKVDASTGALTNNDFLTLNPTATIPSIDEISSDPQGKILFGAGGTNTPAPSGNDWIVPIVIGSDGKLSLAAGGSVQYPEGNNGTNIPAPAASNMFVFAADPALYSAGAQQPSKMFTFAFDQTTGAMGAVQNIPDGLSAGEQVTTPSGKFLYSETRSILSSGFQGPRELAAFRVNSDGSLTPISPGPLPLPDNGFGIRTLTMSPNGNFLYAASMYTIINPGVSVTTTFELQAYEIDQNTGALSKSEDYTWDATKFNVPTATLVIDPNVKYVYFAEIPPNSTQRALVGMNVDPVTGALSPIPGVQNWPLVSSSPQVLAIVRPQ